MAFPRAGPTLPMVGRGGAGPDAAVPTIGALPEILLIRRTGRSDKEHRS